MFQKAKELYYVQYESNRISPKTGSQPILYSGQVELVVVGDITQNQGKNVPSLIKFWASSPSRSTNGTYVPRFGELSYEELRLEDHESKENFQFTAGRSNSTIGQSFSFDKIGPNWEGASKLIEFGKTSGLKCSDGIDQVENPQSSTSSTSSTSSFTALQDNGLNHVSTENQSCLNCNPVSGDQLKTANNQTDVKPNHNCPPLQIDTGAKIDESSSPDELRELKTTSINEPTPMQGIEYACIENSESTVMSDTLISQGNRKKMLPRRRKPGTERNGIFQNTTADNKDFFKTTTKIVKSEKVHKKGVKYIPGNALHNEALKSMPFETESYLLPERRKVNNHTCHPEEREKHKADMSYVNPRFIKQWHQNSGNTDKGDNEGGISKCFINQPAGNEKLCISESIKYPTVSELDGILCQEHQANDGKESAIEEQLLEVVSCKTTDEESNIEINGDLRDSVHEVKHRAINKDLDGIAVLPDDQQIGTRRNCEDEREHIYKKSTVLDFTRKDEMTTESVPLVCDSTKSESNNVESILKRSPSEEDPCEISPNVSKDDEFLDEKDAQLSTEDIESETNEILLKMLSVINFKDGESETYHPLLGLETELDKPAGIHTSISEQTNNEALHIPKKQDFLNKKSTHFKSSPIRFENAVRQEIQNVPNDSFASTQSHTAKSTSPTPNMNYDDYFMFCRNDFEHIFDYSTLIELDFARNPFADKIVNITASDHLIGLQNIRIKNRIVIILPHGKGTLQTGDGHVVYCGEFVKGKRDGFGSATILQSVDSMHICAGYYQGNWKNNYRHGHGKMAFLSDRLYEGDWYLDKMHGKGSLRFPDGSLLEGHFVDGKPDGYCTITGSNRPSKLRNYYLGQLVSPETETKDHIQPEDSDVNANERVSKQYNFNIRHQVDDQQFRLLTSRLVQRIQSQSSDLLNQHAVLLKDTCRNMLEESFNQMTILMKSNEKRMVTPFNNLNSLRQEMGKLNLSLSNLTSRCDDIAQTVKTKQKNVEDGLKSLEGFINTERYSYTEMSSLQQDVKRLKEEKEKLEDLTKCQICHENTRDCIIMPCMHMKTCSQCLRTIRSQNREARCPICRGPIQGEIHCKL